MPSMVCSAGNNEFSQLGVLDRKMHPQGVRVEMCDYIPGAAIACTQVENVSQGVGADTFSFGIIADRLLAWGDNRYGQLSMSDKFIREAPSSIPQLYQQKVLSVRTHARTRARAHARTHACTHTHARAHSDPSAVSATSAIITHRTAPHRTAPHRTTSHRTAPHRTACYAGRFFEDGGSHGTYSAAFTNKHCMGMGLQWRGSAGPGSYGLYSYGLYSYGLCSYGLYSYGPYSYGHNDEGQPDQGDKYTHYETSDALLVEKFMVEWGVFWPTMTVGI